MTAYTVTLPCDESAQTTLILFRNVSNCSELRRRVLNGELPACLIKAEMVLETFQVLVAVNKAVHNQNHHTMKTRNIGTEIIYSMSGTKNISDSLSKFAVSDSDTSMLVVLVNDHGDVIAEKIKTAVQGTMVSLDTLKETANQDLIKKVYNIQTNEHHDLLNAIVNRISTKDLV